MNAQVRRALVRLTAPGAVLAPMTDGSRFAVFSNGDRRRRPLARLSAGEVRELVSAGVVTESAGGYVLSGAGRAAARREGSRPGEDFISQHAEVAERAVIDRDGDLRSVRGLAPSQALARLAHLRDAAGAPWLNEDELKAAQLLRRDWELSQAGLTRASDWSAPPMGAAASRATNGREAAMAARCDARRRFAEALDALAAPLRRVVERACLQEEGLEAIERAESWPARSGKLALKLGLAQLASRLG